MTAIIGLSYGFFFNKDSKSSLMDCLIVSSLILKGILRILLKTSLLSYPE